MEKSKPGKRRLATLIFLLTNGSKEFVDSWSLLCQGPVNIDTEKIVIVNQPAEMLMEASGKKLARKHAIAPLEARARNVDPRLISGKLLWARSIELLNNIHLIYPSAE